jgi:hypothetical protein
MLGPGLVPTNDRRFGYGRNNTEEDDNMQMQPKHDAAVSAASCPLVRRSQVRVASRRCAPAAWTATLCSVMTPARTGKVRLCVVASRSGLWPGSPCGVLMSAM